MLEATIENCLTQARHNEENNDYAEASAYWMTGNTVKEILDEFNKIEA
jgi:hypothetical protein